MFLLFSFDKPHLRQSTSVCIFIVAQCDHRLPLLPYVYINQTINSEHCFTSVYRLYRQLDKLRSSSIISGSEQGLLHCQGQEPLDVVGNSPPLNSTEFHSCSTTLKNGRLWSPHVRKAPELKERAKEMQRPEGPDVLAPNVKSQSTEPYCLQCTINAQLTFRPYAVPVVCFRCGSPRSSYCSHGSKQYAKYNQAMYCRHYDLAIRGTLPHFFIDIFTDLLHQGFIWAKFITRQEKYFRFSKIMIFNCGIRFCEFF